MGEVTICPQSFVLDATSCLTTPNRIPSRRFASQEPSPNAQFDPWILWVTVRRCWPWAVPIGTVLASIAAFAVMQNFVPSYKASHWLEANEDFLVFDGVMPTVTDFSATEKPLFYNSIVIDPVLADSSLRAVQSFQP